jgi:hypothetical protein
MTGSLAVALIWSLLHQQQRQRRRVVAAFAFQVPRHSPSCLSRLQSSTSTIDVMSGPSLSVEELRAKRLERLGIATSSLVEAAAGKADIVKENTKPKAAAKNRLSSSSSQVISLLSDDESEESLQEFQTPPRKKQARKTTAATMEEVSPSSQSSTFSVATWNVWFGPDGEGSPYPRDRMKAICEELLSPAHKSLWFIGFQEVVDQLYDPLSKSLESANYTLFRQPTYGYGCAMAVHKNKEFSILDHGWQPYTTTQQDRGLLWVRVRAHTLQRTILFGTTHLESYCGTSYTGAAERAVQVRQIHDFCETKACDLPIINGDMNWDDELSPRSKRQLTDVPLLSLLPADAASDAAWTDTWLVANGKTRDPGYTYDPKQNPMFNGGNLQRRFDRCLIRGKAATVQGRPQIVGQVALPGLKFHKVNPYTRLTKIMPVAPSDHFGYVCQLQFVPK